jgi:hypothetical protein
MADTDSDVVAITQLVNLYGLAVDSQQWQVHHRPGPKANQTTVAGTAVPAHLCAHDAHRSPGEHPPPAANTVRTATKQNSLLLTHEERSLDVR